MINRADFPAERTPIQSSEAAEKSLPFVAQWLDSDHIVFTTDFPHSFTLERVIEEVKGFFGGNLPAELSRKILWDNPKRLYGIYGAAVGYHLAGG
jgi:predicted TIM-barrel fold metal-dependent hydrolase